MLGDKRLDGKSLGVFAHGDWAVTNRVSLISGIRYDWEEKSYVNHLDGTRIKENFNEISPKFALHYRMSPGTMFHGSVSKGYQSGGFSDPAPSVDLIPYEEESLWAYEVGCKTRFWDNKVSLNTAIYYMDITDMQVYNSVAVLKSYRSNAAEATSKGVELELSAQLRAFASVGYNETTFNTFKDDVGDYEGKTNPFAPDYNYNIGVEYRGLNGLYGRCDINGYGEMYFDKANQFKRDAYDLVNVKLGYETEDFDLYLYGKNIFDKVYDSKGYYNGFFTIYSPPREVGITANWRF